MTHKSPDIIDTEGHFLVLQLLNWVVIAAQQPFRKLGQEGREGSWSWIKYPTQMSSERSLSAEARIPLASSYMQNECHSASKLRKSPLQPSPFLQRGL